MRDIIRNSRAKMIQFEYGGTYRDAKTTLKEAFSLLEKNYVICMIMPSGILPLHYSKDLETYKYSNWLAISRRW